MSKPPLTTILFANTPSNTGNWLVGIDTQFFGINSLLKGVKMIPDGLHFVHYSLPTSDTNDKQTSTESSIRYGQWIDCRNDVYVLSWSSDSERFSIISEFDEAEQLNYSKHLSQLGDHYNHMIEYPDITAEWNKLIQHVDIELVEEYMTVHWEKISEAISTVTPSKEENMILSDQLAKRGSKEHAAVCPDEVAFTILQFKKNRAGYTGESVSKDYLDKSWYLEELFGFDQDLLLGELEISFVLFVVLGNFCSGLQWMNLLKLMAMSKRFFEANKAFSVKFLDVYLSQLQKLPREYVADEVSLVSAVDMKRYVEILENFVQDIYLKDNWTQKDCCGKMKIDGLINDKWQSVVEAHKSKFNIDMTKLETKLDTSQMEVFDINDYDENDDNVPTIVK